MTITQPVHSRCGEAIGLPVPFGAVLHRADDDGLWIDSRVDELGELAASSVLALVLGILVPKFLELLLSELPINGFPFLNLNPWRRRFKPPADRGRIISLPPLSAPPFCALKGSISSSIESSISSCERPFA
jgi:hypothetical protein